MWKSEKRRILLLKISTHQESSKMLDKIVAKVGNWCFCNIHSNGTFDNNLVMILSREQKGRIGEVF